MYLYLLTRKLESIEDGMPEALVVVANTAQLAREKAVEDGVPAKDPGCWAKAGLRNLGTAGRGVKQGVVIGGAPA